MTSTAVELPGFGHAGEVLRLVERFEDGTLPKPEWTHTAHLAVGLWYASRLPHGDALNVVRRGIHALNEAHGVVTTPAGGYHETITRVYMRVISAYIANEEGDVPGDWSVRVNRLLARHGARDLPLRYYTRERLMSADARFGWLEPDVAPLPSLET
jgi:hypothetical protein